MSFPLDMAEFRLDDGEWSEKEEILRLDNQIAKSWDNPGGPTPTRSPGYTENRNMNTGYPCVFT